MVCVLVYMIAMLVVYMVCMVVYTIAMLVVRFPQCH